MATIKLNSKDSNKKKTENEIDLQIKVAREAGLKEIKDFELAYSNLLETMKKSSIFNCLTDSLKDLFDGTLTATKSIVNGHNNMNMPRETFIKCREEVYKKLIEDYYKKKE